MELTIFTPTYNRADSLYRLFDALCRQTDKRFEWLIVDDGSTDNTKDLIEKFSELTNEFEIRYYIQPHGGKHRAQNLAIDLAKGQLFITCDSNKYLADNTVELILNTAQNLENIPMMCGVGGYRSDFNGNIWGGEILFGDNKYIDCNGLEHEKYHISGDKSRAFFTDILKNYKSPVYPNETFISESSWLLPMAMDGYITRWIPEVFVYGDYSTDGLTKQGANSHAGHVKNFNGFLYTVKLEKEAKGLSTVLYLLFEALDISRSKNMSAKIFMERTGLTVFELIYLNMFRTYHNIYNKMSHGLKTIIGPEKTDKIRKLIRRFKEK